MLDFSKAEVWDKSNDEIRSRKDTRNPTITFTKTERIVFSGGAAEYAGLRIGSYVHFMKLGTNLYFYVDDDTTGFKISLHVNNSTQVRIGSENIQRKYRELTGRPVGRYQHLIIDTGSTHNNKRMFEVRWTKILNTKTKK